MLIIFIQNFTEKLRTPKSIKSNKELVKQDLSNYLKKTYLFTRLDNIKKDSSKKFDSTIQVIYT